MKLDENENPIEEVVTPPAQEPAGSEATPPKEPEVKPVILDGNAPSEEFDKVLDNLKTAAVKANEATPPETPPATPPAEETPATPPATDNETPEPGTDNTETEDKTKAIQVTDEYIKSQPEELKEILAGIKGKTVDPQVLKNYVHAEKTLLELRAKEVPEVVKLEDITIPENEKQFVNELAFQKLLNENPGLREKQIELKERGIEKPEEIIQEYLRDLNADNPEKAYDFVSSKRSTFENAEKDLKQVIYIKKNENVFARRAINQAKEIYVGHMKKLGVENPEELIKETGLDFTVLDANGSNAILKELIWAPSNLPSPVTKFGGNGDPNDFNDPNATYVFNPEVIALRAFALKSEPLFKANSLKIQKASFEKGFKLKKEKEEGIPPSHSTGNISGKIIPKSDNSTPRIDDNDFTGNDDEKLAQIKDATLKILKK